MARRTWRAKAFCLSVGPAARFGSGLASFRGLAGALAFCGRAGRDGLGGGAG